MILMGVPVVVHTALAVILSTTTPNPAEPRRAPPRHGSAARQSRNAPRAPHLSPRTQSPPPPRHASAAGPSFLDAPLPRIDWFVLGLDGGNGLGFSGEVATMYWRHLMVVPLSVQFHFIRLIPEVYSRLGGSAGPRVGFGGFHGRQGRFSHWLVVGVDFLFLNQAWDVKIYGLVFPVGYDFRSRFGRNLRWVWGVRAYVAPIAYYKTKYPADYVGCETGRMFCDDDPKHLRVPLMAGVCLFLGI